MITMQFAGRLGKDAETRQTQGGETVTSFSVGCNAGRDKTVWVECAMFGERGTKLAQYLKKGTPVAGSGRPSVRVWQDKQGNPRADQQCAVFDIALLGGKCVGGSRDNDPGYGGRRSGSDYDDYGRGADTDNAAGNYGDFDNGIPF